MPLARQHIEMERHVRRNRPNVGVVIRWEDIQQFVADFGSMNHPEESVQFYRRKVQRFYENPPEGKTVRYGTLQDWRTSMLENGYAPGTVNAFLSTANSYLDYIGRREYQLAGQLKELKPPSPEMSRAQYLHLLQTARSLGKERVYFLVKLFDSTGIFVQELPEVAVTTEEGKVICNKNKYKRIVTIPSRLKRALLDFAWRKGILSGPIFRTQDGRPMRRTYVSAIIRGVCEKAKISCDRTTPQTLRKLYLSTRYGIESNVAFLIEQVMEQEQLFIGWADV